MNKCVAIKLEIMISAHKGLIVYLELFIQLNKKRVLFNASVFRIIRIEQNLIQIAICFVDDPQKVELE